MSKITIDELVNLFGDRLPIEAIALLFPKEPHGLTADELRSKLKVIAALKGQQHDK